WGCPVLPGVPVWGCALQASKTWPGSTATISPTSPSLFFQVCNCDKYLKVSRERMKQLVVGSRQALGDSGTGCLAKSKEEPSPGYDAACPRSTPHGEQLEGLEHPGASMTLPGGAVLQVSAIPPGVLDKAELTNFYCCTRCGKVFWEGSHFGRIVSQFQDVLVANRDEQSFYDLS
ncbi:MUT7 Exonuclease, partial [Thinocorus orbignyianus]|nr:MUT7 Exonuclease [Thinocorus orbignyianus]